MSIKKNQCLSKIPFVFKIVLTVLLCVAFSALTYKVYLSCDQSNLMFIYREAMVCAFFAFLLLNVHIDYTKLYGFIFKYRYPIALIAFICLVAAKINLSSIGMFDAYVQPRMGSEFVEPVFGEPRSIRSDEWAVSTPRVLTYQYCAGEKYNDVIMATETPNLQASGVALSFAMLAQPIYLGHLFLSAEYAVSFQWCGLFILTLLGSVELFYIISKRKPLLAFMGGVAVAFSSFCMWWSGSKILAYGMTAVAAIYHFLNTKNTKKRIICGIAVAIFGASYVCTLYPAWLVPIGYIFLAIIIWCFVSNFKNIKTFKCADWIIFSATVVFALAIIAIYYISQLEYAQAVSSTVYPGARREYGGYALNEVFNYVASLAFPFKSFNGSHPFSEYGSFFSFFPMPIVFAVYVLIKQKKKDLLNILLLVVTLLLTIYCTVGLPKIVATVLLMTFSSPMRVAQILGVTQILLLIRSMSIMQDEGMYIKKRFIMPVAAVYSVFAVYWCDKKFVFQGYMSKTYMVVLTLYIFAMLVCFVGNVKRQLRTVAIILFVVVHCVTAAFVLPISKGLDSIYSKPAATAVSNIVKEDPDAKWIAVDQWVESGFYAACGAKVINSNNYIPNLDLWDTLLSDEEYEKYNEVYNRYSNFIISLTDEDTEPTLNQPDLMTLKLNYSQLDDIEVKYLAAKRELSIPKEYNIELECIYAEGNIYIYELLYN